MESSGVRARISARARDLVQDGNANVMTSSPAASSTSRGVATNNTSGVPNKTTSTSSSLNPWGRMNAKSRYRVLDIVINCLLLTPLAVLFQVGSTGMQDSLFMRSVTPATGTCILMALGVGIEFGFAFWQHRLSNLRVVSQNDPMAYSYIAVTRLYHFAIGFANVCHYRGLSDIYYGLMGTGARSAIQLLSTTTVLLLGLRCTRNLLGPPLCVGVDTSIDQFFETSSLFRTKSERYISNMADHAVTVTLVTSLCCLHWIAVWTVFDNLLYPDDPAMSVVVTWVLGYALVFVMFFIESNTKAISRSLELRSRAQKIMFEDVVMLVANVAVILVWRGHWVFFEALMSRFPVFHGSVDVTAYYGTLASFLMMCLLHTSATLIMKGCDVFDGEIEGGEGLAFDMDYFAEFFRNEIQDNKAAVSGSPQQHSKPGSTTQINNNVPSQGISGDRKKTK